MSWRMCARRKIAVCDLRSCVARRGMARCSPPVSSVGDMSRVSVVVGSGYFRWKLARPSAGRAFRAIARELSRRVQGWTKVMQCPARRMLSA